MNFYHKLELVIILYLLSISLIITSVIVMFYNVLFKNIFSKLSLDIQILTILLLLMLSYSCFYLAQKKKKEWL
jgi:uncharacterized membrane protein YGL010W